MSRQFKARIAQLTAIECAAIRVLQLSEALRFCSVMGVKIYETTVVDIVYDCLNYNLSIELEQPVFDAVDLVQECLDSHGWYIERDVYVWLGLTEIEIPSPAYYRVRKQVLGEVVKRGF